MDLLASLIRLGIAPLWAAWERSPYLRHHRSLLTSQYDPAEVVHERQLGRLQEMVRHATLTTKFWRDALRRQGLAANDIRTSGDFRSIPILTKEALRNKSAELVSSEYHRSELVSKTTSGSTGQSVEVFVDEPAMQFKRACTLRSDEWSGWRLGEKTAKIWGNPEFKALGLRGLLRNQFLERARYLDTLKMNEEDVAKFAFEMARWKPALIFGHAHSVHLFASYLQSHPKIVVRPRGVITSAMVLHDWERTVIESAFSCSVTNRYGCEEVSLIACQCEAHGGLHVNAEGVYVETLRPDGTPAGPGNPGSIVVTDLVNRGMPILRYKVGDMGVLTDEACACGRGLPVITRIAGREADYVVTPSGELVSGISLTENFAVRVPGISQLQIIQERIDELRLRIVRGPEFGAESDALIKRLVRSRFGDSMTYRCEFVKRIAPGLSGKYRFCISRIPNPYLTWGSDIDMPSMTDGSDVDER